MSRYVNSEWVLVVYHLITYRRLVVVQLSWFMQCRGVLGSTHGGWLFSLSFLSSFYFRFITSEFIICEDCWLSSSFSSVHGKTLTGSSQELWSCKLVRVFPGDFWLFSSSLPHDYNIKHVYTYFIWSKILKVVNRVL